MRNFVPKLRVRPKKKKSLPHYGSISVRNFGSSLCLESLRAKWALLAKKPRGPDVFRPLQCQTRGGAASLKSTPVCLHLLYICDRLLWLVVESARKVANAPRCTFWQVQTPLEYAEAGSTTFWRGPFRHQYSVLFTNPNPKP